MSRDAKLWLLFAGLAAAGAWLWFSQAGRQLTASAGSAVATGAERLIDLADSTLQLIKRFEGFSSTPYVDAQGYSIGYGHYMGAQPTMQSISESDAYALMRDDVSRATNFLKSVIAVPVTQSQFDALASLAYNIGNGAFGNSTLLKKLNAGDYQGAADQFLVWNKSSGAVNPVLVTRRAQERGIFLS